MFPPELRGFALLVLVCALAFPSVAQVTYNFSAPSPGVSWSFTVPALLTAETTITDFGSSTGNGPNCTIPYVTISDPLGMPSVTTGLGSTCTFTGSWNKLRHKGYLKVSLFPSFNATGSFIDPTQTATLTITSQIATPAITGTYYVEYFANNADPLSGTPDQIIRVINVGLGGDPISNTGNICEAVYVFNADQVIQACCQCVLKPNELARAGQRRSDPGRSRAISRALAWWRSSFTLSDRRAQHRAWRPQPPAMPRNHPCRQDPSFPLPLWARCSALISRLSQRERL